MKDIPQITEMFIVPDEHDEVMPGIKWGNYGQVYTPAYWKYLYHSWETDGNYFHHRLGENIIEEIVACMLGGYGIPSEVGISAFNWLKEQSLIKPKVSQREIAKNLSMPFICNGRVIRYRFYNQKAKFIHSFLNRDDLNTIPLVDEIQFRDWLLKIDGIGLKTASWITRNWFNSEKVAILDIHILRAGILVGLFQANVDVNKQYRELEEKYISFCRAIDVRPSTMDALIWHLMKKSNQLCLKLLSWQS